MQPSINVFHCPLFIAFLFHLSPRLCPSTAGCSPPSMSSVVFCLLLSSSRWFPPSLLCRLAIFCLVVLLISSLFLVATLCSVWSTYCPSFLLYDRCNKPKSLYATNTTIVILATLKALSVVFIAQAFTPKALFLATPMTLSSSKNYYSSTIYAKNTIPINDHAK